MAASGTGNRNRFRCLDSVPPHSSMRTSKDYVITRINQQINTLREGAWKEGSRRDRFTYPYPRGFYKSDDFISDEMSEHGSIDFVALDGDGCHGAGSTEMQNSSPVISRRKQKAKLRKRRQKALKALAKQTAQGPNTMVTVHDIADSTPGMVYKKYFSGICFIDLNHLK